jgi:hypothetical protein
MALYGFSDCSTNTGSGGNCEIPTPIADKAKAITSFISNGI